jgi:hypothetical protein
VHVDGALSADARFVLPLFFPVSLLSELFPPLVVAK